MITQEYESQKVLTATPMELILMLYDGAIRSLNQALAAFELADPIEWRNKLHEHVLQAQSYITELTCSLDIERGGEMAMQIERLYGFMIQHLVDANASGQKAPVEAVKQMLEELRDGWAQAMASLPKNPEVPQAVPVERTRSFQFSG